MSQFEQVTSADDAVESNQDASNETLRTTLQRAVNSYVSGSYQSELSAGGVYARDEKLHVAITGEKINLKNFWSGKWNSTWTVTVSGSTLSISGDIKVRFSFVLNFPVLSVFGVVQLHVHYFEDGNLQLQSSKPIASTDLPFKSYEDLAEQVVKHIQVS